MARADTARAPARGGHRAPTLAAVGGLVLAAAAWLLAPVHAREPARGLRLVLVDASASVTRLRPGWPSWARRALTREALGAEEASLQAS